jgi:hypothetical protein
MRVADVRWRSARTDGIGSDLARLHDDFRTGRVMVHPQCALPNCCVQGIRLDESGCSASRRSRWYATYEYIAGAIAAVIMAAIATPIATGDGSSADAAVASPPITNV